MTDRERIEELYQLVSRYADDNYYLYTKKVLSLLGMLSDRIPERDEVIDFFLHGFEIAKMLIDFQLPIDGTEEDYVLSAVLLHIISKHVDIAVFSEEMIKEYGIEPRILSIIDLVTLRDNKTESDKRAYYERIKKDKLALIVRIAERANLVERLYIYDTWRTRKHIADTKEYFFPICLYVKEFYPELTPAINIMTEKMRTLIDVAEILLNRFEHQEDELNSEILSLKEDNARIRLIIRNLKKE